MTLEEQIAYVRQQKVDELQTSRVWAERAQQGLIRRDIADRLVEVCTRRAAQYDAVLESLHRLRDLEK